MKRLRGVIAVLLGMLPARAAAQRAGELTLDFRPFAGVLGYAWRAKPGTYIGLALGGGIDEFDKTLNPDTGGEDFHKFQEILHASVFARRKVGTSWDLDLGARVGIGDVRNCTASDCWPGYFVGGYVGGSWGGDRWKVGPRLIVARVRDNVNNDNVVHLEFVTGRLRIGR